MELDAAAPEPLPQDILEYWCSGVYDACQARWKSYINEEDSDYRLDEDEIMDILKEANMKFVGDMLGSLVEKGAVEMSVGEDGEIYYKATEQGKSML